MLTGTVHRHAALLNFFEEVLQFVGSLPDVSDEAFRQQLPAVHQFEGNGHLPSPWSRLFRKNATGTTRRRARGLPRSTSARPPSSRRTAGISGNASARRSPGRDPTT